jgi:DNA-binding GntR family transcriptional regulator
MALDTSIPARIVELMHSEAWPVGSHLPAQKLADRLRVSRSPINEALQLLHDKGLVQREPNRGHFVARALQAPPTARWTRWAWRTPRRPATCTRASPTTGCAAPCPTISPRRCCARPMASHQARLTACSGALPLQLHDRGVRFHEALVEASGNAFFIDTIRRVNRVRRLLSYRSMQDRKRYQEHARQHLHLLDLLAKQRNLEASEALRHHLGSTLRNITKIQGLLKP